MSGWPRKVRAAAVVALAFGLAWGTIVTFAVTLSFLFAGGLELLASLAANLPVVYGLWVLIGFVHGLLISLAMSVAGRNLTVDSFPRWLGALIGAGVGGIGAIVIAILESAGGPKGLATIGWAMVGLISAIGAVSTVALLTVARRGALPPAPAEPKNIGS